MISEFTGKEVRSIEQYVYLYDQPVAILRGSLAAPEVFFVYADHLNTPRVVTNAVGKLRWRWDAPPFGEGLPDENPGGLGAFTLNLRFPGQYFDRESGLAYNYFRDYDPQTGRYVQPDPLGVLTVGGSMSKRRLNHIYEYANQDPLLFLDPRGEQGVTVDANFHGFLAAFGGKASFGFAFGNNFCLKVETCGRAGAGVAGGVNLTAGFTTGELCTKVVDSSGLFASGGPFLGGLSSVKDSLSLSASVGGGVGGGIAGGIEGCRTQYFCIVREPCGCTTTSPTGNLGDLLAP